MGNPERLHPIMKRALHENTAENLKFKLQHPFIYTTRQDQTRHPTTFAYWFSVEGDHIPKVTFLENIVRIFLYLEAGKWKWGSDTKGRVYDWETLEVKDRKIEDWGGDKLEAGDKKENGIQDNENERTERRGSSSGRKKLNKNKNKSSGQRHC